jgi:hypothetical protein
MVALSAFSLSVAAQGIHPVSPDAMGLYRQSSTSIDYYTGALAHTMQLATLPSRELNEVIALSYNGSGFKVHDIASSTGLGMNLLAGGIISRIVRDKPDDLTNGYCQANSNDKEPDLFFYSFKGHSGKFFLDAAGNAYTIPWKNLSIKSGICAFAGDGSWEIKDEDGITYKFGKTSSEKETSTVKLISNNSTLYSYTSTWYLSEVESPNKTDKITYSYLSSSISFKNFFFEKYEQCNSDLTLKDNSTITTSNPKLISSITTATSVANFGWMSGRQDLTGGYYLRDLTINLNPLITEASNPFIKKYKFKYSYFQASGCNTEICKRLKLDFIYDLAPDPLYSFTYYTNINLPSRESKNFDHWGYYNTNTFDSWLPGCSICIFQGASRDSDGNSLANLLKTVSTREGGSSLFEYETHIDGNTGSTVGGARIKKITVSDGNGGSYIKSYLYGSNGLLFFQPTYTVSLLVNGFTTSIKRFSSSLLQVFDLGGAHIGYSVVEEATTGMGKTVYRFSNYNSHPDENVSSTPPHAITYKGWERGNLESLEVWDQSKIVRKDIFEFDYALQNKNSANGIVSFGMSQNNCPSGTSSSSTVQSPYSIISRPINIKKHTSEQYDQSGNGLKMSVITEFQYDPATLQLLKTTKYDAASPGKKYTMDIRYVNNSAYNFNVPPDCSAQFAACVAACGGTTGQCYADCQIQAMNCNALPTPSSDLSAILNLRARKQVNAPVEVIQSIDENSVVKVLGSNLMVYAVHSNNSNIITVKEAYTMQQVMPTGSYSFSIANADGTLGRDSHLRKIKSFNSFDATTANLLQRTTFNGIQTSYTWGYNNTLTNSVTTNGGVNTRTSSATYKPLVGVLTATDANNLVEKKEYDAYNRLKLVKDGSDNILQMYRYHYAGETIGFTISTSVTETLTNSQIAFYIQDVTASIGGAPQFVLDYGDGTVVNNPSSTSYHSYATAGTYQVKLTGSNAEYNSITRSLTISVHNPVAVSLCIDGVVSLDLCGIDPPYTSTCSGEESLMSSMLLPPGSSSTIYAMVTDGCPASHTYNWQYRVAGSEYWSSLGSTGSSIVFYSSNVAATYEIRCTVTDACWSTAQSSTYITYYESTQGCAHSQQ